MWNSDSPLGSPPHEARAREGLMHAQPQCTGEIPRSIGLRWNSANGLGLPAKLR